MTVNQVPNGSAGSSPARPTIYATVVKLADTADSKSVAGNSVRVQVPLVAPFPDSPGNVTPGADSKSGMSGIVTRSREALNG